MNRWEGCEHTCCAGGGTSNPAQIQLPQDRRVSRRTGHISVQLGHTLWVLGPRCPTVAPCVAVLGSGSQGTYGRCLVLRWVRHLTLFSPLRGGSVRRQKHRTCCHETRSTAQGNHQGGLLSLPTECSQWAGQGWCTSGPFCCGSSPKKASFQGSPQMSRKESIRGVKTSAVRVCFCFIIITYTSVPACSPGQAHVALLSCRSSWKGHLGPMFGGPCVANHTLFL